MRLAYDWILLICLTSTIVISRSQWEVLDVFFFFFSSRRRHTRFDCDWSSDVCSSDLTSRKSWCTARRRRIGKSSPPKQRMNSAYRCRPPCPGRRLPSERTFWWRRQIGRASWRGRGEISVVGGSLKKKKEENARDGIEA